MIGDFSVIPNFASFFLDFGGDAADFFDEGVGFAKDILVHFEEAGEGYGGKGNGAHEREVVLKGLGLAYLFEEAADIDAQESNLVVEAYELVLGEVSDVGGTEAAGVEAGLDGVLVAGLGAAEARGFSIGHV